MRPLLVVGRTTGGVSGTTGKAVTMFIGVAVVAAAVAVVLVVVEVVVAIAGEASGRVGCRTVVGGGRGGVVPTVEAAVGRAGTRLGLLLLGPLVDLTD